MLVFHRNGKYWLTLHAPSPAHAAALEQWIEFMQPNTKLTTPKDVVE